MKVKLYDENIEEFIDMFYCKDKITDVMVEDRIGDLLNCGYTKEYLFTLLVEQNNTEKVYKGKAGKIVLAMYNLQPTINFIYKLYQDSELVYVGRTTAIKERLSKHRRSKKFNNTSIYLCNDTDNVDVIENGLIRKYMPPLNKSINLEMARQWDGLEPKFNHLGEPCCKFIDSTTTMIRSMPSYLLSFKGGLCVRNDKNIKPYFWN